MAERRWWRRRRGVPFLTDEWCAMYREVVTGTPELTGATATFENAVRRNDGELRSWTVRVVDGVVEAVVCGPDPDADMRTEFAVQDDYARFIRGDTRPVYDAYWKGSITVTGDLDAVVAIAPLMDAPAFKAQLRQVYDQTDFG
jgi:hypothetical protein